MPKLEVEQYSGLAVKFIGRTCFVNNRLTKFSYKNKLLVVFASKSAVKLTFVL